MMIPDTEHNAILPPPRKLATFNFNVTLTLLLSFNLLFSLYNIRSHLSFCNSTDGTFGCRTTQAHVQATGLDLKAKLDNLYRGGAPNICPEAQLTVQQREIDAFLNFTKAPGCDFTSQDLHLSFEPKCKDKESVLRAMSSGGRHGLDQPYKTLGCDMQWFGTSDICNILAKFDRIYVVGDSLMRQLAIALHILIREDLNEGARMTLSEDEGPDDETLGPLNCRCRTMFEHSSQCFWWQAIDTSFILEYAPESIACGPQRFAMIEHKMFTSWPLKERVILEWITDVESALEKNEHLAYIFGTGNWNSFNASESAAWIMQVEDELKDKVPSFFMSPRLYMSPSAVSGNKPEEFIALQNNLNLVSFIETMDPFVRERGYDHLASYNASIQSTVPDGTHPGMEMTILQAMMVLNWVFHLPERSESPS